MTRSLCVFALPALLALASCGGGGGGAGGTPGTPNPGPPNPAPPAPVSAPAITTAPTGQRVLVGQTAMFAVVASGDAPLAYEWLRNNSPIQGGTQAQYSL